MEAIKSWRYIKYNVEHWHISKVISKNQNLIELSIINSNEIIILDNENNLYGPNKVSPNNYLKINDYIFVTKIDNSFYAVQLHDINGAVIIMDPFNGDIVSMVGGVNYEISNLTELPAYRQLAHQ